MPYVARSRKGILWTSCPLLAPILLPKVCVLRKEPLFTYTKEELSRIKVCKSKKIEYILGALPIDNRGIPSKA